MVIALAGAHFASFFDAQAPIQTDARYYVHFARLISEGGVPHLDYFDNKTQLASLTGALFMQVGGLFSVDPLSAIRVGYLGIVALGGILAFLLYRRLAGGDGSGAFLAFLPYLGFTYLGSLPAVGNVPKVILAVSITGAALALCHRRYLLAGAVAALAPLDWQIGVVAPIGVLLAATFDSDRRGALIRVLVGGAAVAALFTLYLLGTGSLGAFWEQTVGSAFARGEGPFLALDILQRRIRSTCEGELWLVGLALLGMACLPWWVAGRGARSTRPARVALLFHHAALVAFSCKDFQGSGDAMLLLHSLAFFAAVLLGTLHGQLQARLAGVRLRRAAAVLGILSLTIAVRPVIASRPTITTHDSPAGTRLSDQERFRSALGPLIEDRSVLVLGPSELMFLKPFATTTPFIYWNAAAAHVFTRSRGSDYVPSRVALERMVLEADPDIILTKLFFKLPSSLPYRPLSAKGLERAGPYQIRVYERSRPE